MSRPMPTAAMGRFSVGVVCSIGVGPARGGRARNEDNYLVCRDGRLGWRDGDTEQWLQVGASPHVLLAVADGMGGHEDGELASAAAVQALSRLYARPVPLEPEETLREFLLDAHRRIRARVAVGGAVKMGTTLSVAWVVNSKVYWAHVGDSRLYHWREGRLTRITRDQTRAEFARRDNRPIPSHPMHLSQNFIYGSRGLGDDAAVRIDRGIDTGAFSIRLGDRLVLCSDGLTSRVEDPWIADVVRNVPEPGPCAVALMERAIANQSDDNITVVVLRVDAGEDEVEDGDTGDWSDERTIVPV
jgi:serine/threonine protein phosphatase PrpC